MNSSDQTIQLWAPVERAFARMKDLLFRPFDLSRWLAIGFCGWLAQLGEGGGFNGGGNWGNAGRHGGGGQSFDDLWEEASTYVMENLSWIVPLVAVVLVVALVLGLLILWVSSRGRFMFLDNVVTLRAEVARPWTAYAAHAHSLFLLRVGVATVGLCTMLPLMGVVGWAAIVMLRREAVLVVPMSVVVVGVGVMLVLGVVLAVFDKLTKDFVVPIMWRRTTSWRVAWGELRRLLGANVAHFVLYILFQIGMSIVLGVAVLIVVLATCCLAGCLLAIPYLGTVLFLPVLVFLRAFSAYYLAQFGPEFDVFTSAPAGT